MDYKKIRAMMDSDTRTPNELFVSLCGRMKALSGDTISDDEAARAVRRLIGLCETIMRIPEANRSIPVETSDNAE